MNIELNNNISESIKNGYLKAKTLVEFLLTKGFRTNKNINDTALKDLTINDKNISSVIINGKFIEIELI